MKKQICLTQDDIQQIIANAFNVDNDKVYLETYKDLQGYGTSEHYVAKVKATVEVPMNDQR
jgi:ribosomal protein S24E